MGRSKKYLINIGMLAIVVTLVALHSYASPSAVPNSVPAPTAADFNNLAPGSTLVKKSIMSYQDARPVAGYSQTASISNQQASNCQEQAAHAKQNGATEAAGQDVYYNCLKSTLGQPAN